MGMGMENDAQSRPSCRAFVPAGCWCLSRFSLSPVGRSASQDASTVNDDAIQKTHQQTFHINKGPTAMDEPGLADAARAVLSSDRPLNGLSPKFDTGTLFACGRAKTASDCLLHGRHNAQGIPRSWTRRQFRPRSPPRVPEFRPFTRSTVRECGRLHDVRVLSAVQGSQAFPALVFAGSRLGS
jgi:hypothetical protein